MPARTACRLVPITQDQWTEAGLRDVLLPDMEVKARIVKVKGSTLTRIQNCRVALEGL